MQVQDRSKRSAADAALPEQDPRLVPVPEEVPGGDMDLDNPLYEINILMHKTGNDLVVAKDVGSIPTVMKSMGVHEDLILDLTRLKDSGEAYGFSAEPDKKFVLDCRNS